MPQTLRIDLDRSSPMPLYHQIATAIEHAIDSGQVVPGEFLENEVSLAARLNVSRPTARQAMQDLVERGRLLRRRGVGTQVAPAPVRRPLELTSLHEDLARAGRTPRTEVLAYETLAADRDLAARLEVPEGAEVVHIRRLRFADGGPLAVMSNHVRAEWAPSRSDLGASGLYALLRQRGLVAKVAHERVGARLATAAEARILDEKPRAALLTMTRTAYTEDGAVVDVGDHVYRASRYEFSTTVFAR